MKSDDSTISSASKNITIGDQNSCSFYSYEVYSTAGMAVETAQLGRSWMDNTRDRFAYRCLPLLMANTAGWVIKNPIKFYVSWNGGDKESDVSIQFPVGRDDRIRSHFGNGVLTFTIPYLFRTPKQVNLWVKGPSNSPKDGIQALEGIVETDWAVATFTMNWKLTRPNHLVSFAEGEPICMIVPVLRGLAEGLDPIQTSISANRQLQADHDHWTEKRKEFLKMHASGDPVTLRQGWERDYFKGCSSKGQVFEDHQTQIALKEFKKRE